MFKAETYLQQARRLNLRISFLLKEIQRLKFMSQSISSPSMDREKICNSRPDDSSFACILARISEMEHQLKEQMGLLIALENQVRLTIGQLHDPEKEIILCYRYLEGLSWTDIGYLLHMDRKSVRNKHGQALNELVLPEEAIWI